MGFFLKGLSAGVISFLIGWIVFMSANPLAKEQIKYSFLRNIDENQKGFEFLGKIFGFFLWLLGHFL